MNNTPIDYLLQLPVLRPESAPSAPRVRDDAPAFDNHFRQASDAGAAPPSSPAPPRPSESTTGNAQRRPPANEERRPQPAADANSQSPSESESPAESAAAADDAPVPDKKRDREDDKTDESTEVGAVLAAAGQLAKSAEPDAAAVKSRPHGDHPDARRANSAAKPHPDPTNAERSGRQSAADATADANAAADVLEVEAKLPADSATAIPGRDRTAKQAAARATAQGASDESIQPLEATRQENGPQSVKTKSNKSDGGSQGKATANETGEKHTAGHSAVVIQTVEQAAASSASRSGGADESAPKKNDKKSATRNPAALNDATSPPSERTDTVVRASDGPAASPIAANVQQQLATNGAASTDSAAKPKDAAVGAKNSILSPFARLERGSTGGARGSQHADHGESMPHVDPARFVSRVARAIHTAQERGGPLQLRLSPPELGAMRLEISVKQGALTATIETDNSTARQVLLDNLPTLRDRLAEQNVKIERFDVDVRRDPSGSQQNPGPQDHNTGQRYGRTSDRPGAGRPDNTVPAIDESLPIRRTITSTSINVVA